MLVYVKLKKESTHSPKSILDPHWNSRNKTVNILFKMIASEYSFLQYVRFNYASQGEYNKMTLLLKFSEHAYMYIFVQ